MKDEWQQLGHLPAQFLVQPIRPTVDPFEDNSRTQTLLFCFVLFCFAVDPG